MPKELLSAIWYRCRSVLETEGTRSKGGRAHAGGLGEQVVIMVWGSTQCPRWPQSWPRALAPLPKYSSLAARTGPFLREGLPEASLLRGYPALRTESFLSYLPEGCKCPSGLLRRLRTGGASPSTRGGRQETDSAGHRGDLAWGKQPLKPHGNFAPSLHRRGNRGSETGGRVPKDAQGSGRGRKGSPGRLPQGARRGAAPGSSAGYSARCLLALRHLRCSQALAELRSFCKVWGLLLLAHLPSCCQSLD